MTLETFAAWLNENFARIFFTVFIILCVKIVIITKPRVRDTWFTIFVISYFMLALFALYIVWTSPNTLI